MKYFYISGMLLLSLYLITPDSALAQKEFKMNESFRISSGGLLDLKANGAKIRIIGTDNKETSISALYRIETKGLKIGNKDPVTLSVKTRGDTLQIREQEQEGRRVLLGSKDVVYTITIDVPVDLDLNLKGESNNYFIRNVNGAVELQGKQVEAELQKIGSHDIYFDLNDSIIDMDGGSGRFTANLDKSTINMYETSFEFMDADLDGVDLDLGLHLSDNGEYNIKMVKGSLDFDILSGGGRFNILHNDQRIYSEGRFIVEKNDKDETIYIRENGTAVSNIDLESGALKLLTPEAEDE